MAYEKKHFMFNEASFHSVLLHPFPPFELLFYQDFRTWEEPAKQRKQLNQQYKEKRFTVKKLLSTGR